MKKLPPTLLSVVLLASAFGQIPIVPPNTFSISSVSPATSNSTNSAITNDNATNATMFPVWVTASSGNLPLKVSSTQFKFNPSTGNLTLAGSLTFGTSASILNGTTGSIGLTATGTNQSITLTPSGTGRAFVLSAGANVTGNMFEVLEGSNVAGTAGLRFAYDSSTLGGGLMSIGGHQLTLWAGTVLGATIANTTGNLLLGGLTTDGTGVLQFPAATTSAGGITMGTDTLIYRSAATTLNIENTGATQNLRVRTTGGRNIDIQSADSNAASILDSGYSTSGNFTIGTTSASRSLVFVTGAQTTALTLNSDQTLNLAKTVSTYNGIATAGNGVVSVQGAARATAQTGANASVATYTVGASDASFEVSANILVTTATTHAFTCTCAYTDEGNTARTITFTFSNVGGTLLTSIANTGGTVPYEGVPLHIRAKASTSITIATTGTFTSVVYNVEGVIRKLQ